MARIISAERSILPACDVRRIDDFQKIVKATAPVDEVAGYKVGYSLGLRYGLPEVVKIVRDLAPGKKVIYDHQKAGTDIPDQGAEFADTMAMAGVDAAILFPQAGPATQEEFIRALQNRRVGVIVGGEMTHPEYLEPDGGYIAETAPEQMYRLGVRKGVRSFVVPGNKPTKVAQYRAIIEEECNGDEFELMSPGLIKQGGRIEDTTKTAGKNWHVIVGRGIFDPLNTGDPSSVSTEQMRATTLELASMFRGK